MKRCTTQEMSVLALLQELSPDSSKNTLRGWLKQGRVTVDQRKIERADQLIYPGQTLIVGPTVHFLRGQIRVLFEDQDLIVLEKPEGLLSVAKEEGTDPSVHTILKRKYSDRRIYPVHRLDRDTSGVMLFTFSKKAQEHLKKQFEEHLIEKVYYAAVEHRMEKLQGTWESYLKEDDFYFVKSTSATQGKFSITEYETVASHKNYSLLRLQPKTGRKNQLRVHCSEAGHPIVGDKKYGATSNPLKRVALHAQKIAFVHPLTEKKMYFSVPLPECFYKLVKIKELNL